jgi:hypothetical protein
VGFTDAWEGLRGALWQNRTPENEAGVAGLLELKTIKTIYLRGSKLPKLISPDNWNSDFATLQRPNARRVHLDLFYDYRTNVALYPKWQAFLRSDSLKPSFSGRRTISSSLGREEKLICRICPKPRCTGLKPGTSPSRIA